MKKNSKLLVLLPFLLVTACGRGNGGRGEGGNGGYDGPIQTITLDGGGDISNFNTTASMVQSSANPYPYNTLETLCKEWEKSHPAFKVKVNKTSNGGDRATVLSQLKTKTAADIIYQNGTVVNSDLGQDYYVNLSGYLDSEDPYLPGKAKWSTVYNEAELASMQAADGEYYYACLEKIPVCFMYNKTLLAKAGIDHPEAITTYSQLVDAMTQLKNYYKANGLSQYGVYSTEYTWYQLMMESNLFGDMVTAGDVLRQNKMIDTEELCRLFEKNIFKPLEGITNTEADTGNDYSSNRYYEYIKLIEKLDQNKEPATYSTRQGFLLGQLGFIEVTGNLLRTLSAAVDALDEEEKFEWGTIPFPNLTETDSVHATKGVVRGSAGLATSWWVSNSAIEADKSNKNSGAPSKVDACVDLLMYLTAPEQNNKLIGDLKGGVPLNPTADYELADYLKPLIDVYNEDMKKAERDEMSIWGCFNTWNVLGNSYNTAFIRAMQELDAHIVDPSTGKTAEQCTRELAKSMRNTIKSYEIEFEYDQDNW